MSAIRFKQVQRIQVSRHKLVAEAPKSSITVMPMLVSKFIAMASGVVPYGQLTNKLKKNHALFMNGSVWKRYKLKISALLLHSGVVLRFRREILPIGRASGSVFRQK